MIGNVFHDLGILKIYDLAPIASNHIICILRTT